MHSPPYCCFISINQVYLIENLYGFITLELAASNRSHLSPDIGSMISKGHLGILVVFIAYILLSPPYIHLTHLNSSWIDDNFYSPAALLALVS